MSRSSFQVTRVLICAFLAVISISSVRSASVRTAAEAQAEIVARVGARIQANARAGQDRVCVSSNDKIIPSPESLSWCTMYSENSCCSVAEDAALERDFNDVWRSITGHCAGCTENTKRFQCAYTCSPDQNNYVTVQRETANNGSRVSSISVRMCNSFCSSFLGSCGNTTYAEQEENNANGFCPLMIDRVKGSIGLYSYDCFNDPSAPNRCDGTRDGQLDKPETNWFFIACCVILGLVCVSLVVSVVCYTTKAERPPYAPWNSQTENLIQGGAPVTSNMGPSSGDILGNTTGDESQVDA